MMAFLFIGTIVIFLLASLYVASRICRALKRQSKALRHGVIIAVILLDLSFFVPRLFNFESVALSRIIYVVSTTWLPIVLYSFCVIAILEVARKVFVSNFGHDPYHTPFMVKAAGVVSATLLVAGYVNATDTDDRHYEIYTEKLPKGESHRIVLTSDLHTGYAITAKDMERLANEVNRVSPEVVIVAGDLIDGDLLPEREERPLDNLAQIKAPRGIVAVMGNHEYMDDAAEAESILRSTKGLTLLRDETLDLGWARIIGRDDATRDKRYDTPRKTIAEYDVPDSLFSIIVDHQPWQVNEADSADTDLYLAGHTHAGQIWPMSIVTHYLYDIDYGYACFGHTQAIVTSGFGTWGPRMRIGTQSEIVVIDITGTGEGRNE